MLSEGRHRVSATAIRVASELDAFRPVHQNRCNGRSEGATLLAA